MILRDVTFKKIPKGQLQGALIAAFITDRAFDGYPIVAKAVPMAEQSGGGYVVAMCVMDAQLSKQVFSDCTHTARVATLDDDLTPHIDEYVAELRAAVS